MFIDAYCAVHFIQSEDLAKEVIMVVYTEFMSHDRINKPMSPERFKAKGEKKFFQLN